MATTLDVVNDCLASMGEAPLNALTEPHSFKGTATRQLARQSRIIQSRGWWCNTETLTVQQPANLAYIQLPGDVLKWNAGVKSRDTLVQQAAKPWIVLRGKRLYDTVNRTFDIPGQEIVGEIVRELPFEDLPSELNDYIAAQTVLRFQSNFDADTQKRQELTNIWKEARMMAIAEDARQLKVNLIDNNANLHYVKTFTRHARRWIRR